MLNHYYAWYQDAGYLEVIKPLLVDYMTKAHEVYQKPIMMSEYGGDTVAGLHMVFKLMHYCGKFHSLCTHLQKLVFFLCM